MQSHFKKVYQSLKKSIKYLFINTKVENIISAGSHIVIDSQKIWIQQLDTFPFLLDRLSILFGNFQRRNTCNVHVALYNMKLELLFEENISAELIFDNVYYTLKLPEGFTYKGKYYITITSPNATQNNCVAVWLASDIGNTGLRMQPYQSNLENAISSSHSATIYKGVSLALSFGYVKGHYHSTSYLRPAGYSDVEHEQHKDSVAALSFTSAETSIIESYNRNSQLKIEVVKDDDFSILQSCRALLIPSHYDVGLGRSLGRVARRNKLPLVIFELDESKAEQPKKDAWLSYADAMITQTIQSPMRLPQIQLGENLSDSIDSVLKIYKKRFLPKVTIITILSGKEEQLKYVIESYFNQSYEGEIEVIYIDDCFGNKAERIVREQFAIHATKPHTPSISYSILHNEQNLGNCASRNRGVEAAGGDIITIIDADCMLNQHFIKAHVDAHSYLDCEVVIGSYNIETNGVPPQEKLAELERDQRAALESADLQDPLFLDAFLNCITRNFSIKKSAIIEPLFDHDFSYSLSPQSGFGWEDVEMGYRLYKRGLGIKFTEDAFSVHISHNSLVPESEKPKKSIRNFYKLFQKHPELSHVARRWAVRTYDALEDWSLRVDPAHAQNDEITALKTLFSDAPRLYCPSCSSQKKLRILTYRWHVPHQYELYKTGHDFFLVKGAGSPMCDAWEFGQRPLPKNATFIHIDDVNEAAFDLALLHFDENVLNYENTNGHIGPDWGATFRYFAENLKLPKIAICHGTPQFYGQYTPGYDKPDLMQVIEPARANLVNYMKDIEVVCNSYQAQREWGFHKSRVIWHGFDPSEFLPGTYQKGILSPMGPLVRSRPHYRGYYLYQQVFSPEFPKEFLPQSLYVPEPDIDYNENIFAIAKYKNYVDQIRQYSVYFNPTLRSPMPRARCEPMMCGVVTVNANNHDVDLFIKNGVNGFYSNEADELREQLIFLSRNPDVTRKMGYEARATAINVFNNDRYLADWTKAISNIGV